jgi:hypothetical protein
VEGRRRNSEMECSSLPPEALGPSKDPSEPPIAFTRPLMGTSRRLRADDEKGRRARARGWARDDKGINGREGEADGSRRLWTILQRAFDTLFFVSAVARKNRTGEGLPSPPPSITLPLTRHSPTRTAPHHPLSHSLLSDTLTSSILPPPIYPSIHLYLSHLVHVCIYEEQLSFTLRRSFLLTLPPDNAKSS